MDKNELYRLLMEAFNSAEDKHIPGMATSDGREAAIFDAPILGVAAADDPIFETFREPGVVGPWQLLPEEWLPGAKRVISVFFPFSEYVRESNRKSGTETSFPWVYGRIEGQQLMNKIMVAFAEKLSEAGINALIPLADPRFKTLVAGKGKIEHPAIGPDYFGSTWSERHAAYACGLGTFGLSKGLITEKGVAGRFASLIADGGPEADPRPYSGVYDYCTKCGACARRCPVGAIDPETGKDHSVCNVWVEETRIRYAPRYGCGLCQTGVPCEFQRP